MPKTLQSYGGFSSLDIKNRASATCDMVVVGSTVDCTNISVTRVKNVLGSASTAVGGLCTEALVNKWSGFGPREWVINTYPTMDNAIKVPYQLGSFAGYHHQAVSPTSFNAYFEYAQGAAGSTITQSIAAKIKMGEYDWGKLGGTHARVVVFSGASIYSQSGILPITGAGNFITFDNVSFTFNTGTAGTNSYSTKTYICASDGSDIAELPITGSVTCVVTASIYSTINIVISGIPKVFTMIGHTDRSQGTYITQTGTYTGNSPINGKVLSQIVCKIQNTDTNVVESTITTIPSEFVANDFPTELSDLMVNDAEAFSVSTNRYPIITGPRRYIITMYYE